VGRKT